MVRIRHEFERKSLRNGTAAVKAVVTRVVTSVAKAAVTAA
jgi:hypothetical protein